MEIQSELLAGIGREAIALRRKLHAQPELSQREFATSALIAQELGRLGIPYETGVADTGVVACIAGGPGPVVGLRADMDALAVQEENPELSCRSQAPGVTHACGHDAHTAILLGTAKLLCAMQKELRGSVKLIFQPAEETIGGAERMIAAGCLENPHVDVMLGLHVDPALPVGQIGIKHGKFYAASDMFTLRIYGKSCHGAHPDEGVDAILIAGAILMNAQSVVSRNLSATDAGVCTFGTIHGGNVRNQIADYVELSGILRSLDPNTRLLLRERVKTVCEQTASMLGGRAELEIEPSYMPLINTDGIVDRFSGAATELLGAENVISIPEPSLGVEDFAYFAAARPACFYHLGCGTAGAPVRALHSSSFMLDEACIPLGIRLQAAGVFALLQQKAQG